MWNFFLGLAGKLAMSVTKGFNGALELVPTGIWRKVIVGALVLLVSVILVQFAGLWLIYNKVTCETVSNEVFAKTCEAQKSENRAVLDAVQGIDTAVQSLDTKVDQKFERLYNEQMKAKEAEVETLRRELLRRDRPR